MLYKPLVNGDKPALRFLLGHPHAMLPHDRVHLAPVGPEGGRLGRTPSSQLTCPLPAHLSSMRTQRSLNCRGRWCLLCLLCHFFCRPNSSSWLRLSGSRRCGDRAGSSSSGGVVGVTEGTAGTAAAGVTGAGLAEVLSGGGTGLRAAGLERTMTREVPMLEHVIHRGQERQFRRKWSLAGEDARGPLLGPERLIQENHCLARRREL